MKSFKDLNESLKDLPVTWYPALLKTLVEEAIKKNTFVPGGATEFVRKIEAPPVRGES